MAIALVKATFESGFVNNCVLEFAGPGIKSLPIDFRNGIDVMTTETTCLSSIWETDEVTRGFYEAHKRPEDYKPLHPGQDAYYDKMITIDLSKMESMIALPFHPPTPGPSTSSWKMPRSCWPRWRPTPSAASPRPTPAHRQDPRRRRLGRPGRHRRLLRRSV